MTARRAAGALAAAAIVVGIGSIATAAALTIGVAPSLAPAAHPSPPALTTTPSTKDGVDRARPEPPPTVSPDTPGEGVGPALTSAAPASSATVPTIPEPLRPPVTISVGNETATIIPVGVLPDGELQLPDHPALVGWWASSAALGAPTGSVVLAGHVDSRRYGLGTFAVLHTLRPGDVVQVSADNGIPYRYIVSNVEQTPKAALPSDVLTTTGPPRLVLITCGGEFDNATRHYNDNVIVVATPI